MSILTDASLIITPNAYKAGSLLAVVPSNGNGDLTWTRNSGATRVNSAGLIENVLANVPRLDYSLGGCPNILLEPQRTNLATYSEIFTNAPWSTTTGVSVITNNVISPSGAQNAETIIGATGAFVWLGNNTFFRGFSGLSVSTSYMFSVYLKGIGSVKITWRDGITGGTNNIVCNLTSSWQRFELSRTTGVTSTGMAIIFSNASGNFDIWGAQLEAGAYPTSYIPTVASTVTRVADAFNRNNIFTNGLISASGGTWFVEIENNLSLIAENNNPLSLFIGTTLNGYSGDSLSLWNSTTLTSGIQILKSISGSFSIMHTTTTDKVKVAITWNGTTANVFVNGVKVVTNTVFTATNMEFFGGNGSRRTNFIKQMWLENVPMTDVQLIAATTL